MKKLAAAAVLAVIGALCMKVPAEADRTYFNDINDSFAKNDIVALYEKQIIDGMGPGRFEPDKSVTRAEFVKMLSGVMGLEPVPNAIPGFKDVARTAWSYGWIGAAGNLGLVAGKSADAFAPNDTVTREEAAVILVRAAGLDGTAASGGQPAYKDEDSVSSWALASVKTIGAAGLMNGDGESFRPRQQLTREEAAAILNRISGTLHPAAAAQKVVQIGWQYGIDDASFKKRILQSTVNVISPRWFFLGKDGSFSSDAKAEMADWAHANGRQIWALAGNRFDADATHAMLASGQEAAVSQLVQYAAKYGLDGINLDFENMSPGDRDLFTAFVSKLAAQLRAKGKILSVDVPPDSGTDWSDPYDYESLSRSADYIVLMNYEEHWDGSANAGSVSSLPWFTRNVLQTKARLTGGAKLIAGMPLYTRDWLTDAAGRMTSQDLTLTDQSLLVPAFRYLKWDTAAGQYKASYTANGLTHSIWIEDGRSLTAKYDGALRDGAAGFAYWYIGGETPDIWAALRNAARRGAGATAS